MEAIEQALYGKLPGGEYGLRAASPGFREPWRAAAERLCRAFAEPEAVPPGAALFALPLVSGVVAVVQVNGDDPTFRILAVPLPVYRALGADPFWIAEHCPADWEARTLAAVAVPPPPPERTAAGLRPILQRDDGPLLRAGVQALLDGARLVFVRATADADLVRALWALLPWHARAELWPCTFVPGVRPGFHIQVVPAVGELPPWVATEEQLADYPEGRYEMELFAAVEAGDDGEVSRLLARPSRGQMFWLGVLLLILFSVGLFLALGPAGTPSSAPAKPKEPPAVRPR